MFVSLRREGWDWIVWENCLCGKYNWQAFVGLFCLVRTSASCSEMFLNKSPDASNNDALRRFVEKSEFDGSRIFYSIGIRDLAFVYVPHP